MRVVNQAAGCRVVDVAVARFAASRSWASSAFEQFVVGTRVVVRSGPAMMGHAALMVARCTACGADKQPQPAVSVRSRIAIADNGNVVEEQGGGRG